MKRALSLAAGLVLAGALSVSPQASSAATKSSAADQNRTSASSDENEPRQGAGTNDSAPQRPAACDVFPAASASPIIGRWSLRQRDDGQGWTGPWEINFKENGTWTQANELAGYWCQRGDLVIFGFSKNPHTTYRGQIGSTSISGVESWNGGGTGIFEAIRKDGGKKKKWF